MKKRPFSHAEHAACGNPLRGSREALQGGIEMILPEPVDSRSPAEEDYQRLLLDDLLYFSPGPYAMLSAYLDESGTHARSPIMCVAGFLYERHKAKQLDRAWKEVLKEAGINRFHAAEYSSLYGEFKSKDRASSDLLYQHLLQIIRQHACGWGVVYTLAKKEFDTFRKGKWDYGQYTTCAHFCMLLLRKIAKRLSHEKVSFVIESGHENMGELRNLLKELSNMGHKKGPWQFNEKDDLRPLQTADVLAYEAWKRVSEQFNEKPRLLRRSLECLLVAGLDAEVYFLGKQELQELFDRKAEIMGD